AAGQRDQPGRDVGADHGLQAVHRGVEQGLDQPVRDLEAVEGHGGRSRGRRRGLGRVPVLDLLPADVLAHDSPFPDAHLAGPSGSASVDDPTIESASSQVNRAWSCSRGPGTGAEMASREVRALVTSVRISAAALLAILRPRESWPSIRSPISCRWNETSWIRASAW